MALDIESLANVQVSSASKSLEHMREAPSIMSIVSEDDIKRYGAVNLHDVLNRVPSLQVLNSTANPNNVVTLRAATNQHYPNRILFLIDGRPVRDGYGGHLNYGLFTHYPVSIIKQIEVIRGPGSVLYGTDAYAGVVNIVSKDACDECVSLQTTYGSFNRRDQEGSASFSGQDWSILTAVKATDAKGERFTIRDENNVEGTYRTREEGHAVYVTGHFKDLSMLAFVDRVAQSSLGTFSRFPESESDGLRTTLDVGYKFDLLDNTEIETHVTYNRSRSGNYSDITSKNQDDSLVFELSGRSDIHDNLVLSYGGFFEHQDGYVSDIAYQQHLHNLYAQLDYRLNDDWKFVGGMQLNDAESFKADLSPRLAMIYTPVSYGGVKLLYGEAFRSSTAIEREVNVPNFIVGDRNMHPERIKTLEGQIFYNTDTTYMALSAYRSRMEDIIARTANPMGAGSWITNTGEQVFKGIEFEAKHYFADGWQIQGSMAYQTGKSDTGIDDPTFSPNLMAKLGVSYDGGNWSFGVFDSWYGDPQDLRETNPSVLNVNTPPESYHLVSANLNIDLPVPENFPKMRFTLYGENLLNEDINFPEYNRKSINSFPIDNSRAVYGRISVNF